MSLVTIAGWLLIYLNRIDVISIGHSFNDFVDKSAFFILLIIPILLIVCCFAMALRSKSKGTRNKLLILVAILTVNFILQALIK